METIEFIKKLKELINQYEETCNERSSKDNPNKSFDYIIDKLIEAQALAYRKNVTSPRGLIATILIKDFKLDSSCKFSDSQVNDIVDKFTDKLLNKRAK